MKASRAVPGLLGICALLAVFLVAGGTAGCGGDDDSTGPQETNLCSLVSMSSRGEIGINMGCSSVHFSVSGITYDQYSRPIAYNFAANCSGSSTTYSGRVYNITWNNLGEALSADVTINGRNCHFNM